MCEICAEVKIRISRRLPSGSRSSRWFLVNYHPRVVRPPYFFAKVMSLQCLLNISQDASQVCLYEENANNKNCNRSQSMCRGGMFPFTLLGATDWHEAIATAHNRRETIGHYCMGVSCIYTSKYNTSPRGGAT